MEGGKKKGRVYGIACLASQNSGSSSSRGSTQREKQLETELSTVRDELTQVKQLVSSLQAKTANYDELRAQMDAFEETRAQMAAFMRMMQPHVGPSTSFPSHVSSLPFPSTVAPMRRGTSKASTPRGPPNEPSGGDRTDSDAE